MSTPLVNAIGEMRRVARKAGLIAIKIDDIAQVNARFGFDAGDRVLAESAACLMECSRGKGRLFRSTGPTFVALFDDFDPEETDAIAEEIERFLGSPVLIFGSHLNISRPFAWPRSIWTASTVSPFRF